MADKVGELYAELGFKVNEEGLKSAQKMLKQFADELTKLNELTKKQASLYGVFAKERAKQETEKEKQATEAAKQETKRVQQKINQEKHLQRIEYAVKKEAMKEERLQQRNKERLQRIEEHNQKQHHAKMVSNLKKYTRESGRVLMGFAKIAANLSSNIYQSVIAPSLARSINVRDFMMYTGTPLNALQGIRERFVGVGSSMTTEDIMGELASVMDNITKIRFGKGNLAGLKLAGIQGFAAKGNVSKVLEMIENATIGVDNQALVEVLNEIGFSGQKWLPYFRARQRVNSQMPRLSGEQQDQLVTAQTAIGSLRYAFEKTAEILTARLAPAITKVVDKLTSFFVTFSNNANLNGLEKALSEIADELMKFLNDKGAQGIINGIKTFMKAISNFAKVMNKVAGWFGVNDESTPENDGWHGWRGVFQWKHKGIPVDVAQKESYQTIMDNLTKKGYPNTIMTVNNNQTTTTNITTETDTELTTALRNATQDGVNRGNKESFGMLYDVWANSGLAGVSNG